MNIRNFRWDDFPALVDLMNAHAAALGRESRVTLEQVEPRWRAPYNHPERDCFIAQETDGRLVGFSIADPTDQPHHANGVYQVLPGYREVGRALMQAATDHFLRTALIESTPDAPITMQWTLPDQAHEAVGLFEAEGYQQVRQFYTMRIALDQPITSPPLPDGFTLSPFTPDQLLAVYEAKIEAFHDHWDAQHSPLDEWRSDIEAPGFDPSLWWIAYDGDQVAGMVLSQPNGAEGGWIGIVGVRRAWRKRGLAQALLRQCFAEYQRRGYQRVELGVDSDSPTNAVELYERAGMHVHQRVLYYRKTLR